MPLHTDNIQPLAELQPARAQCPSQPEADAGMHGDRAGIRPIANGGD
jgi:hypothetical protein